MSASVPHLCHEHAGMPIFFLGTGKGSAQCSVKYLPKNAAWKCSVNKFMCVCERPTLLKSVQNIL